MSGALFPATAAQEMFIGRGEPIALLIALLIFIALLAFSYKRVLKAFSGVSRRTWLVLALILISALAFRLLFVPVTTRVFFDEDLYLNTGLNILSGQACMCNSGVPACTDCILNKAPSAHPFLLSILTLIFGMGATPLAYAAIVSTLSTLLMFLCAYLFFGKRQEPALLSAVLLSLVPVFIEWSNTAAAEPTILFFAMLSFLFLLLYLDGKESRLLFLFAVSLVFAIQTKAETGLILPLFALAIPLFSGFSILKKPAFYLAFLMVAVLCLPAFLHIYLAAKGSDWGAEGGDKFSFAIFKQNFPINTKFFLFGYQYVAHPFFLTALAVFGLMLLILSGRWRVAAFLLIWFLSFFLLYCAFYAGSVRYGTDVRYTLAYYPALILLAASVGLAMKPRALLLLSAVLIGYFAMTALPQVTTPGPAIREAEGARAYRVFAMDFQFPPNCTVFSHVSSMYLDRGIPSGQLWYLETPDVFSQANSTCLIFDYGYWCSVPPFRDTQCANLLATHSYQKLGTDPSGEYTYYRMQ
jgi:hypothetical protein